MIRKAWKSLLGCAVGAAAFAATPANAWVNFIYYDASGNFVGQAIYCDNGTPIYQWGWFTSNYEVDYHPGEPPC